MRGFENRLWIIALVFLTIGLSACGGDAGDSADVSNTEISSSSMDEETFAAGCYEKFGIDKEVSWVESLSDSSYIGEVVCSRTSEYMNNMSPTYTRCVDASYNVANGRFDLKLITEQGYSYIWASISGCKYKLDSDGDFAGTVAYASEVTLDECLCIEENGVVKYRNFNKQSENGSSSSKELSSSSSSSEFVFSSSSSVIHISSSSSDSFAEDYFSQNGVNFVKIGNQTLMVQNMKSFSGIDAGYLRYYNGDSEMRDKYGTMTYWSAFTGKTGWFGCYDGPMLLSDPVKGACPSGTHLPSKAELEELIAYLNEHPDEMQKIENQLGGVYGEGFPDDDVYYNDDSLEIIMGYHGAEEGFLLMGGELSETADPSSKTLGVWSLHYSKYTGLTLMKVSVQKLSYVRCFMDVDSTQNIADTLTVAPGCDEAYRENWDYLNPDVEYGCIKDERDGRFYKTVIINDKMWLAENLRYVPQENSWCYTTLADGECDIYGRYYSGAAVRDLAGICPEGFHVANSTEMRDLTSFDRLELLTVNGWDSGSGSNTSGFSVLPGGVRGGNEPSAGFTLGEFGAVESIAYFWVRNQNGCSEHYYTAISTLSYYGDFSSTSSKYNDFGMPVRCIKNY